MTKALFKIPVLLLLSSISIFSNAQKFFPLNPISKEQLSLNQKELLDDYSSSLIYTQDTTQVKNFITTIQQNYNTQNFTSQISLPNFQGEIIDYKIENSKTLSSSFQQDNNIIKTFRGKSLDGKFDLRLTLSQMGVMAKITENTTKRIWYIMPLDMHHSSTLVMYAANDPKIWQNSNFNCQTIVSPQEALKKKNNIPPLIKISAFDDCQLRTYRLAVASSAEYTNWSGSQANAMVNIANTINNINEVYERDLGVHFDLYTKNSIIFTNTSTQPYTLSTSFTSTNLSQNISVLNGVYNINEYDLGILFHYSFGGGLAYLSVVCTASKGGAAAGIGSTAQVPYFEQSAMHEIGHQFSAGHSMSANTGVCGGGNYMAASSVEAGGGSSLMSYAGNCGTLAYQNERNNYFHSNSIQEMQSFIGTLTCGTLSNTGNSAPITATNNKSYNIPHSTPFKLSMTAISPNNTLTYAFDQMDLYGGSGTSTTPNSASTFGPLFKTRIPTVDSFRYFPSIKTLLGEEPGDFEVLPTIARTINFKGIVRDDYPGGGCKAQENIVVNTNNCGPFEFTNLNTNTVLVANGTNTFTLNWNTANSCVPTSNVKISFSVDGGYTYPYVILNSTPNDGTETILVPNLATCKGRFMIEAIGNIYFNINKAPVTIISTCFANGTKINPDTSYSTNSGSSTLLLSLTPEYGSIINMPMGGNINSSNPNSNLVFLNTATNTCAQAGNATKYQVYEFYPTTSGTYNFSISGPFGLVANLYAGSFDPNNLCSGFLTSSTTRNGTTGPVTIGNSFSYSLCLKQKYTLVVSTFSSSMPTLPASFTMNITGGTIYNNNPNPGSGYYYGYVTLNSLTGIIKAIKPVADLSNPTIYTAGDYLVYGLSTTTPLNTLDNTYSGGSFNTFSNAILNQTGGICAQLSENFKKVNINIPAALNSVQLKGTINKYKNALLTWEYSEKEVKQFILERSSNGQNFQIIENTNSNNKTHFTFEDKSFSSTPSPKVFYRLRIEMKNGEELYSNMVMLFSNRIENTNIEIFPNPIENNTVQIKFKEEFEKPVIINITDVLGKIIYREKLEKTSSSGIHTIHLGNNLVPGIYYVHINNNGQELSYKISKL